VSDGLLRFMPGACLVDNGPDETHVLLANHNVTFLNHDVTRLVHAFAEALRTSSTQEQALVDVHAATQFSEDLCLRVLNMLRSSGCLSSGADYARDEIDPVLNFWGAQGLDVSRTRERLAEAAVVVVAPEPVLSVVTQAIDTTGVRHRAFPVRPTEPLAVVDMIARLDLSEATVLAVWGLQYATLVTRQLGQQALDRHIPALFGYCSGVLGRIGPFVLPNATACIECTNLRLSAHAGTAEARVIAAIRQSTDIPCGFGYPVHPAFASATLSLFAIELTRICLNLPPRTIGALMELTFGEAESRRRVLYRSPTCPACHPPRPERFGWDATFRSPVLAGEQE